MSVLGRVNTIQTSRCQYNGVKFKREYTVDQVTNMYNNDYINFNLKNLFQTDLVIPMFLSLDDINIREEELKVASEWYLESEDPFLKDTFDNRVNLGLDIINRGTYWPIIATYDSNNSIYVLEGIHRIVSLKMCQKLKYIDGNFKVFTICIPYDKQQIDSGQFFNIKVSPVKMRFILEVVYDNKLIVDTSLYDRVVFDVENQTGGGILNEYTGEWILDDRMQIFFHMDMYPMFLRDLIHKYNTIKPNPIFNNQSLFNEWVELNE